MSAKPDLEFVDDVPWSGVGRVQLIVADVAVVAAPRPVAPMV
jgi:hypothetical protein